MSPLPNPLKNKFGGNNDPNQIRSFCCIYLTTETIKPIKLKVNSRKQSRKTRIKSQRM